MSSSAKTHVDTLDETTWYSVLGLTSQATDVEIRKSYMRLAKRLHPDKSKMEGTAELFKVVVNAHSILTDSDERRKYDNELRIKNLYEYNVLHSTQQSTKNNGSKPPVRKSKPYGEQPYGFGFPSAKTTDSKPQKKSSVPIFQSFNLKTYQRRHNHKQEMETEQRNYRHNAFRSTEEDDDVNNTDNQEKETPETAPSNDMESEAEPVKEETTPSENTSQAAHRRQPSHISEDDTIQNKKRSKVVQEDGVKPAGSQTHIMHEFRRAARHKAGLRDQVHRSVSPVKVKENKKMDNALKDSFTSGINVVINQMFDNILKESRESSPETHSNEASGSIPTSKRTPDEMINDGVSTEADMYPERSFDMKEIDDTLDSIPLTKKTRLTTSDHAQTENIHEPVNYTLPRVYKRESLSQTDNFGMDGSLEEMDVSIPQPPIISLSIGQSPTAYELELLRNETRTFYEKCNNVKAMLLRQYSSRTFYDQEHSNQLFKVENFEYLNAARHVNTAIMDKIREIEETQQVAIQQLLSMNKLQHK